VRPDELERRIRQRLDALGPAPRAELLIDCEEDRTLRAVLVGMLRERHQAPLGSPKDDAMDRVLAFLGENPGVTRKDIEHGVLLRKDRVNGAISTLASLDRIENRGSVNKGSWYVSAQ
jgi:predicted HTH transcriptional regulator